MLVPTKQIVFAQRLKELKGTVLQKALLETISSFDLQQVDRELHELVAPEYLSRMAQLGLRGELLFPIPSILVRKPSVVGYYRLLLGFSQKDFSNWGLSRWSKWENHPSAPAPALDYDEARDFCQRMIKAGYQLMDTLDDVSTSLLHELTILTLGSQFRGSYNNLIGNAAAEKVFDLIGTILKRRSQQLHKNRNVISLQNASGRQVTIRLAADPDVLITEELPQRLRHVLAIEIKGGADQSNLANRLGEAEKTHLKYKKRYAGVQCWTIVGVQNLTDKYRGNSPSTDKFFVLNEIMDDFDVALGQFEEDIVALIGLP